MIKGANKSKNSSSVVNIGSMYGSVSPDKKIYKSFKDQNPVHYGSTKAGLIQMTKYFATILAEKNIIVNSVSPGGIENHKTQTKKFIKNYSKNVPIKRMANLDEILEIILYLIEMRGGYLTGQNLVLDGGLGLKWLKILILLLFLK